MNWTDEQQLAINKEGSNILVSAGAGSGKTAVLSERVLRKLNDGISIDNLLILTFTNAAAREMKDRIRNKIKSNKEEYEKISSAYITTFDSFCYSVVKKYHYKLNIPKDIKITDQTVIDIEIEKIITDYFEFLYENDDDFLKLLSKYTLKDDNQIKKFLIDIYKELTLLYDIPSFLNSYESHYYSDVFIDSIVFEYENLIKEKLLNVNFIYDQMIGYNDLIDLSELFLSKNYNAIKTNIPDKLPNSPNGSSDEFKELRKKLKEEIDLIKELCKYQSLTELKEEYLTTKKEVLLIVSMLKEIHNMVDRYKRTSFAYSFIDIEKLAIKIVKEHSDAREYYKNKFNEILIDEYQDTSDIQELFINLISKNNVYMVGDIKQSIYRFRNANPDLFKVKYENYNSGDGIRIDLNKNFRSNKDSINHINKIFNKLMDSCIGGANYRLEHNLIFGNKSYEKLDLNSNSLEVIDVVEGNSEKEIFAIGENIQEKINNKLKIYDKDLDDKRNIKYSDITILLDRSNEFDNYKKIFEYLNIPINIIKDINATNYINVHLLKNLLIFVSKQNKNEYDTDFKYVFTSISRSYLFEYKDPEIYDIISNNRIYETDIYKLTKPLSQNIDHLSIYSIVKELYSLTNIYQKTIKLGDVENNINNLDNLLKIAKDNQLNYNVENFIEYLTNIINNQKGLSFKESLQNEQGVKLMTIHASKGLEFPVVYYSGLTKRFNIQEINSKFIFNNKYGIVLPIKNESLKDSFLKKLVRRDYVTEEISEKIRLFYVALTRAREKIILVSSFVNDNRTHKLIVPNYFRNKFMSFQDFLDQLNLELSGYIKAKEIEVDGNYKFLKTKNYHNLISESTEKLKIITNNLKYEIYEKENYSDTSIKLLTDTEKENINKGNELHKLFENLDLETRKKTGNEYVDDFLELDILKNIKSYRQEYDFVHTEKGVEKIGSIDLLVEKEEELLIIDFKLSNINKSEYIDQLNGYKEYMQTKTNKPVRCFLYSIIKKELKEIIS